ncbi:hypothetical protein AT15_08715 [Kosmotoga arenicorallina S304]|uniref:Uncharacterized protein n=1 Tax=Kosmotoga arenicorallina S304 TaxID=1453497 RepID=A0A176K1P4_9BACT|nr:hypothetical protein [Kosmotoga arenicorallina]OAA31046.1 hypothetical protein AT15_08715 [Kosmotoga arenicorallina S304]
MLTEKRQIKTIVYFGESGFYPVRFSYDGIKIYIKSITYLWMEKKGNRCVYYFSVVSSRGSYVLEYHEDLKKWFCSRPGGW